MNERTMKIKNLLISLFVTTTVAFAYDNPTAPEGSILETYSGDFTDTDGDGMTDVAEIKYGFDPNDSNDYPKESYTVSLDYDDTALENEPHFTNNRMLFSYNFEEAGLNAEEQNEFQSRCENYLAKLLPIMYSRLGHPNESFVCEIYRLGRRYGYWTSYGQGRKMEADSSWNPRLFIHELIHGWKGRYKYYGRDYRGHWHANQDLSGFEEASAEGVAYELVDEYIRSYPTDTESIDMLKRKEGVRWSNQTFNYDIIKNLPYTATAADVESGLGLWAGDGASVYERYAIAGNTYQILLNKNPDFYRLVKEKFQEEIQKNSSWRPSHEKLRTIFESIVPTINGVSTSDYFKTIPVFSEEKLSGLYPVIRYTEFMSRQNIYLAYGDDYRHEFWWTFGDEKLGEANIPNWINKTKDSYDYYVPVFSEEPFVLNVNTIFGENAIEYIGKTRKTVTESNPIPRNLGGFSPSNLAFNKFPRGLYNQQIEFTNYTQHTANAKQNYYVMGTKNLVAEDKSDELIIYVGIDSQVAESAELQIGNVNIYSDIVNGTALFRTRSLSKNASGEFTIKVNGLQSSHTYIRNLIANGEIYSYERMQKFLIIDRDFDGTEDAYDDSVIELNGEPRFNYSQVESNSTELMNKSFQEQINYDVEYELTDDNILTIYSSSPLNRDETFVLDLLSDSNIIQSHNIKSGKVVIDLSKIELNSNELQIQLKSNEYNVFQDYSELFVIELNKDEDPYSADTIVSDNNDVSEWWNENNTDSESTEDEIKESESIVASSESNANTNNSSDYENAEQAIQVLEVPEMPVAIKNAWDTAIPQGENWYYLEWFGYFFKVDGNNWVYHETLGWFYTEWTMDFNSVWMYHDTHGWIWTSTEYFPYLYLPKTGNWVYLINGAYYDFNLGKWVAE
tara:strand:- start:3253 stop:5961 length:2709 start_codon:yes stop_codon:yes gene_type:complete